MRYFTNSFVYSLKVWFTTLTLGAIVLTLVLAISNNDYDGIFEFVAIACYFGLLFSIPAFGALILSTYGLLKAEITAISRKAWLTTISVILLAATMVIAFELGWNDFPEALLFLIPYTVSLCSAIWIFRLREPRQRIFGNPIP